MKTETILEIVVMLLSIMGIIITLRMRYWRRLALRHEITIYHLKKEWANRHQKN